MPRKRSYNIKRLSMFVPEDIHKELQRIAEKRHDTITRIVMQSIIERILWEKKNE